MMIALPLGASAFYGATSNFPWDNPAALGGRWGRARAVRGLDAGCDRRSSSQASEEPRRPRRLAHAGRTYLVSVVQMMRCSLREASALGGGRDPEVELDLAEALVLSDKPEAQGRARTIIEATLAADANNQKALWYSGLMAVRANDPDTARKQWNRLLETNPPEEIRQILVAQLAELGRRGAAGRPAARPWEPRWVPPGRQARLPARRRREGPDHQGCGLARSDARRQGHAGHDRVVSAREAGIPGPPIAAVRLAADQLPTTVVLSDANAMIEGRDLSSVDELQLVARVAFGGTAVTTSGDLLGEAMHRKGPRRT